MPFGLVERPALGLSLLKSALERRGVRCDVDYPNLAFAGLLGLASYRRIATGMPENALGGEWVFSEAMFGSAAEGMERFGRLLLGRWNQPAEVLDLLLSAREAARPFVEQYVASVDWPAYDLVGFASCCHQNVAALAVARRVKARHPTIPVVFGGPNWDGRMGIAQHRQFAFVDFACIGEADTSFPALVDRLAHPAASDRGALPGVARRVGRRTVVDAGDHLIGDLDKLPTPDHEDYFAALAAGGLAESVVPTLGVETSRGCWWAESRPCTFCGQNGTSRGYREKSPARALDELVATADRWPASPIEIVDNVVSRMFLAEVLPALMGTSVAGRLFFEARPTLGRADVERIAALGCTVQIGIESLSDHPLALMRKGSRALENVRLLKWCRAAGVEPTWNLLYGIPGETDEDLEELVALLPALRFLHPPRTCGPVSLDRFSTYFEEAAAFGLRDVTAVPSYACAYPLDASALDEIAYCHDFAASESPVRSAYQFRLRQEVRAWRGGEHTGELRLVVGDDGSLSVVDSRAGAEATVHVLDPVDQSICMACDQICTRDRLLGLAGAEGVAGVSPAEIEARIRRLVDRRLIISLGDRYLSLALPPVADPPPAAAIEGRAPRRVKMVRASERATAAPRSSP